MGLGEVVFSVRALKCVSSLQIDNEMFFSLLSLDILSNPLFPFLIGMQLEVLI